MHAVWEKVCKLICRMTVCQTCVGSILKFTLGKHKQVLITPLILILRTQQLLQSELSSNKQKYGKLPGEGAEAGPEGWQPA